MNNRNNKTPVVASPMVNISHQQSKKAAKAMNEIHVSENIEIVKKQRKLEKILVAVDGSEKSTEALDFALNLNKMVGAEIEIFTVNQNTVYPWIGPVDRNFSGNPSYMNDFYMKQRQYSERILDDAHKRAETFDPEFKVTKKVVDGTPAHGILEEAEDGFDLIVMGSRGHGFIDELILGSVSKRVMDDSKIPVLVVK